jgi:transcription elongation factor Elf1
VRHDAEISIQDPSGMNGIYPCPDCGRDTSHSVLSIVNSNHFEGVAQFWDHYLTVRCNGCGTVSFCHVSKCSEEVDYDQQGRPYLVKHKKHYPVPLESTSSEIEPFIDISRIQELEKLQSSSEFDTTKLAQMLSELDRAYRSHSFLSCAILIRAILDHVPPIFGLAKFPEVANNYAGGGRSFRESMQHLEKSSRKISDSYLHMHIRKKESLPTKTQVEFRADVDVLIGEVIRVLRQQP